MEIFQTKKWILSIVILNMAKYTIISLILIWTNSQVSPLFLFESDHKTELLYIKMDNFRGLCIVCMLPSSHQYSSLFDNYPPPPLPKPTLPQPHPKPNLNQPNPNSTTIQPTAITTPTRYFSRCAIYLCL